MNKELTLAKKFHNAWTNLYADDEIREFLTVEECKVMDEVETALKDYELLKKCLYVGNSGAIAITSYGFENHDLLEKVLK